MRLWLALQLLLILTLCLKPMLGSGIAFGSRTILVPTDFSTIQEAINAAVDGDSVLVQGGVYEENVVVDKAVSLVGQDTSSTRISGGGIGPTVTVTADNVSVAGFTIENGGQNATGAGILVSGVHYCNISGNVVVSSYAGVSLVNSSLNLVQDNHLSGCNVSLSLDSSANNALVGNTIADATSYGIFASNSPGSQVSGNSLVNGTAGAYLASSANGTVRNNTVVGSAEYGLRVESSSNCTVGDNFLSQNAGGGLSISLCSNCTVRGNIVLNNSFGILVQVSNDTFLVGNTLMSNGGDGIYVSNSPNCMVFGNNVSSNAGNGLVFQFTDFGQAVDNYFENNTLSGIDFYTCTDGIVRLNTVSINGAGIGLGSCPNVTVNGNVVYGNVHQGVLLKDSSGSRVSMNSVGRNGWEGLNLQNSGNSTVDRNVVYANGRFGIWLQDSPEVDILGCNVSYNGRGATPWDGIYLRNSNHSRILSSVISGSGDAGCRAYYTDSITFLGDNITGNRDGLRIFISNNNTISDNEISSSSENGINIFNSTGNMILDNRFVNNTFDVLSQGSINTWDDGYPAGGNYWSNYTGVDVYWGPNRDRLGSDGIGDIPYVIDPDNMDRYPLMAPFRFHDLTFVNVSALPKEVFIGWIFSINATITNSGTYVETFSVTAYYGEVVIGTDVVDSLTVGESYAAILTWNTSSLQACQTNNVKVKISTVPVELLKGNDTYGFGSTKVKIIGDANGDGKVNVLDVAAVGTAFRPKGGESGYRLNYDMNMDNVINILDVALTAKNCGRVCT